MKRAWVIAVNGYGSFIYKGTEAAAEEVRARKSNWERGVAVKRLATDEEVAANKPLTTFADDYKTYQAMRQKRSKGGRLMGRAILKLNDGERDWYLEWSTVVDAPVTYGMSLADMETYQTERYGTEQSDWEERVKRLNSNGTTWLDGSSVDRTIAGNRAGKDEARLTKEQLIEQYCHRKGQEA